MAELKPKKFGYVVHPPPPHFHPPFPQPPPPPPGISMTDWIAYINSYIDVRARQLYDKLKGLIVTPIDNPVRDYVLLKDKSNGDVYLFWVQDGVLNSALYGSYDHPYNDIEWSDETGNPRKVELNS